MAILSSFREHAKWRDHLLLGNPQKNLTRLQLIQLEEDVRGFADDGRGLAQMAPGVDEVDRVD